MAKLFEDFLGKRDRPFAAGTEIGRAVIARRDQNGFLAERAEDLDALFFFNDHGNDHLSLFSAFQYSTAAKKPQETFGVFSSYTFIK